MSPYSMRVKKWESGKCVECFGNCSECPHCRIGDCSIATQCMVPAADLTAGWLCQTVRQTLGDLAGRFAWLNQLVDFLLGKTPNGIYAMCHNHRRLSLIARRSFVFCRQSQSEPISWVYLKNSLSQNHHIIHRHPHPHSRQPHQMWLQYRLPVGS